MFSPRREEPHLQRRQGRHGSEGRRGSGAHSGPRRLRHRRRRSARGSGPPATSRRREALDEQALRAAHCASSRTRSAEARPGSTANVLAVTAPGGPGRRDGHDADRRVRGRRRARRRSERVARWRGGGETGAANHRRSRRPRACPRRRSGRHGGSRRDPRAPRRRLCRGSSGGWSALAPERRDDGASVPPRRRVQPRRRLIEDQHLGIADKGQRKRQALPFASGQAPNAGARNVAETHLLDELVRPARTVVEGCVQAHEIAWRRPRLQPGTVLGASARRAPGTPGRRARILAEDPRRARVRLAIPLDDLDQRRLAGSVRPDECNDLAGPHSEVHAIEDPAPAVRLPEPWTSITVRATRSEPV